MEANVNDPIIPNPSGGMNTDQSALIAEPVDEEHNRRRLFISGAAALAVPILGMYAYLEFAGGFPVVGVFMGFCTAVLLTNAWLARRSGFGLMAPRITLLICCMIILLEVFHHDTPNTLMFSAAIPLAAVFAFGLREGLVWSLTMWLVTSAIILNAAFLNLPNISESMIDFTASYGIVLLLTMGYETLQQRARHTARRHVDQLRIEQQRLEDFASVASDWMFELDEKLCFTSVSEKWSQSLQLPTQLLIGQPITVIRKNLKDPDETISSELAAALMEHQAFHDVQFSVKIKGQIIHLTANAQPIFDPSGTFTGYRGTAKDITDMVASQELIREKDAELLQAQKMEAIGQLTSGVAHDFNNLLTVINGNLELMKLTLEDSSTDTAKLDAAILASDRAAELTSKLLAFARRQPLDPESVIVGDLITELQEMLRRTLGEQVSISLSADPDLWFCHVDTSLLESAILNLAINARDAMPEGGELHIRAENAVVDAAHPVAGLGQGEYVVIRVTDTGTGIPPDQLPHVFEPFFTTKPQGEGSGLGLSMVYGFANQSGGHADISSRVGQGTRVNVYLPRYSGEQHTVRESREEAADVASKKILVVEDEGDVRELVATMTETLGHDVRHAGNSNDAREILKTWRPEILISDVVLGAGETGPRLAEEAVDIDDSIKVLLMSGYPEFALEGDGQLDTSWRLLKKPFGRQALRESLQKLYA